MGNQFEVPAATLVSAQWRKPRRSGKMGNCIELAELDGDRVAIRQSRHPAGTALIYTRTELAVFLDGAKDGEFDDLVS